MKVCCENCFNYIVFKNYIKEKGVMGSCSFCSSQNVRTIEVKDEFFSQKMSPFVHKIRSNDLGFELDRFFTKQIDLLSRSLPSRNARDLLYYLFRKSINRDTLDGRFGIEFEKTVIKSWEDFKSNIKHGNRFGFGIDDELIESLIRIIQTNEMQLKGNKMLFRARLGSPKNSRFLAYEGESIMTPPKNLVSEGRINPKGIPYLYLAEDVQTAIAEVRPFKGKVISVAEVSIKEDTRITSFNNTTFHGETLFEQYKLYSLTNKVNRELSKPADESEKYFSYIPTQYIAELAKHLNFEGIAYESSLESGINYCLFNQEKVSWVDSQLYKIKQVSIEFEPVNGGFDLGI